MTVFAGNGESSSVQFRLRAFQFTNYPDAEIYLHCEAHICDLAANCIPNCSSARRRRSYQDTSQQIANSVGPITVVTHP